MSAPPNSFVDVPHAAQDGVSLRQYVCSFGTDRQRLLVAAVFRSPKLGAWDRAQNWRLQVGSDQASEDCSGHVHLRGWSGDACVQTLLLRYIGTFAACCCCSITMDGMRSHNLARAL